MELCLRSVGKKHERPAIDVVFVHGLGGDPLKTWMSSDRPELFWPEWIQDDLPRPANVWSLGYPAGWTNWMNTPAMGLPDRARSVLDYLSHSAIGRVPAVFVAHSMGGLLVKQLLRTAADTRRDDWDPILNQTFACAFIATPHQGASLATLAEALEPIVNATDALKGLTADNPLLRDLNQWYRANARRLGIETHAIAENNPVRIKRLIKAELCHVVDLRSADPGVEGCVPISADGDHFEVCKPTSRTSPVYTSIRGFLARSLSGLETHSGVGRRALRQLLGDLAADERHCLFVLSSFQNAETSYQAPDGKRELRFRGETVSFEDASAAMMVSSLVTQVRTSDRLEMRTTGGFQEEDYDKDLMLIGSSITNRQTEWAHSDGDVASPHVFELAPLFLIRCRNARCDLPEREWHPNDKHPVEKWEPGARCRVDYAMVQRLARQTPSGRTTLFVLAGLGPIGTKGAANYLRRNWRAIDREYGDIPFSLILRFARGGGPDPSFKLANVVHRTDPADAGRCLSTDLPVFQT